MIDTTYFPPPGPYHNWDLHNKWVSACEYLLARSKWYPRVRFGCARHSGACLRVLTNERTVEQKDYAPTIRYL